MWRKEPTRAFSNIPLGDRIELLKVCLELVIAHRAKLFHQKIGLDVMVAMTEQVVQLRR